MIAIIIILCIYSFITSILLVNAIVIINAQEDTIKAYNLKEAQIKDQNKYPNKKIGFRSSDAKN